jgi:transcriptional regulator with XRE-family HTH domain
MAEQATSGFAGLLRQLRAGAGLTQQELAKAAGLSPRSVSDLERGINRTARQDTAVRLACALGLAQCRLPRRTIIQLAATASRALPAIASHAIRFADPRPGTRSQGFGACWGDGQKHEPAPARQSPRSDPASFRR